MSTRFFLHMEMNDIDVTVEDEQCPESLDDCEYGIVRHVVAGLRALSYSDDVIADGLRAYLEEYEEDVRRAKVYDKAMDGLRGYPEEVEADLARTQVSAEAQAHDPVEDIRPPPSECNAEEIVRWYRGVKLRMPHWTSSKWFKPRQIEGWDHGSVEGLFANGDLVSYYFPDESWRLYNEEDA